MWATILGFLSSTPWIGSIVTAVINWYEQRQAAQAAAAQAEGQAEVDHQDDGHQSVVDRDSDDQQNQGLNQLDNQHDNPTPVAVVTTTGDKK